MNQQSASALGEENSILHLQFHPTLEASPVRLPNGLSVVITNSLAPHALADSAPERYNLRVVEVLCASRILLHAWGVDAPRMTEAGEGGRIWLREALDLWAQQGTDAEMFAKALASIPAVLGADGRDKRGWTREEMIAASGMSEADFTKTYLDFVPVRATHFQLFDRAQHTFSESLRVACFVALCEDMAANPPSGPPSEDARTLELGKLLDGSHESLRDQFNCTVPEVETLRDICLAHGSLGSRQTGGGWGGAVISLLPVERVHEFVASVKAGFPAYASLSTEELEEAAFATLPGVGAGVYPVGEEVNGAAK